MLRRKTASGIIVALMLVSIIAMKIETQVQATSGTIRVQYLDGFPRSDADVYSIAGSWTGPLGTTDSNGQVPCDSLPDGTYTFRAYYPSHSSTKFGSDTLMIVPPGGNITADYEITPPIVTVLSPQNQTTYTFSSIPGTVPLTYSVYDFSPLSWTGYSLDGHANTTITGNFTLASLSYGSHNIIVYSNDTFGNMGSSGRIYFAVHRTQNVTIRVQYLDGTPRPGADVFVWSPAQYIGATDSNGQVSCNSLPDGGYTIFAFYPSGGSLFGQWTFLGVPEGATITAKYEITPPIVTILSPQNRTYYSSSVRVNFTVHDYSPISWMGYSLDRQANVTISGNTTIVGLSDGTHQIVVYANDTFGNMGSSSTAYFTARTGVIDIAVINILTSKTQIVEGYSLTINATVRNEGNYTETFNVTLYGTEYGISWPLCTFTDVTLAPGSTTTLTISFGLCLGFYPRAHATLSAYAWPVLGETHTSDNTYTDGTVLFFEFPLEGLWCGHGMRAVPN